MNLYELEWLTRVVRTGSFSAAARELNVDPSSISRAVAGLEAELGVRLFQRSTRRLGLTEAGAAFVDRLYPLLDEFQAARLAAVDAAGEARGVLRLSVSNTFGLRRIVPLLPDFSRAYPLLKLDLVFSDAVLDLLAERIDVAVRLGTLSDSSMVALPLLRIRYRVVASPGWLKTQAKPPVVPEDMGESPCLSFALPGFRDRWRFTELRERAGTLAVAVTVRPKALMTSGIALRECVLGSMGPSLLPDWLIDEDIAAGRLVDLFPNHAVAANEAPSNAWLVYPSRSYVPAKVRAFTDFMQRSLR
ncbi:LysR family transcriptional regulator [Acidovorax sp.]|uniref:LysR family transcriptional regulator n=1 Tax=Acidovorax sp. TaxID=1872122 RepID=UPI002ACE75F6|nr:LysR family transcriptional regulator [Acidovorax sp.]MDZ7862992.1 LysR family transcriptional regulator [Acidovorax sp.]